jgi:hypothetical protein
MTIANCTSHMHTQRVQPLPEGAYPDNVVIYTGGMLLLKSEIALHLLVQAAWKIAFMAVHLQCSHQLFRSFYFRVLFHEIVEESAQNIGIDHHLEVLRDQTDPYFTDSLWNFFFIRQIRDHRETLVQDDLHMIIVTT